jgi:hypothetical protein
VAATAFHPAAGSVSDGCASEAHIQNQQENTTMLTKSKIALSLALVLATASATLAAPRHAVRQHAAAARALPARSYLSFGSSLASVRAADRTTKPTYMTIQDIGFRESLGD